MPLPPGFVPDAPLSPRRQRTVVPPHIRATHLTVSRQALRTAALAVACFVGMVLFGAACYSIGYIHAPTPAPAPIPVPDGPLRVILVVDNGKDMTSGQLNALASTKVRAWLDQHCAKDDAGRPAWRQWAPDQDAKDETADWQSIWDDVEPQLKQSPQVVIARGRKAKIYPLPDGPDELLKLLETGGK